MHFIGYRPESQPFIIPDKRDGAATLYRLKILGHNLQRFDNSAHHFFVLRQSQKQAADPLFVKQLKTFFHLAQKIPSLFTLAFHCGFGDIRVEQDIIKNDLVPGTSHGLRHCGKPPVPQ